MWCWTDSISAPARFTWARARRAMSGGRILRAIGPVWDGNEVWLLAAGGTLYFAFPLLYASSFSGFYLPLMMVLWLLMLRGIGIELRAHMENPVWVGFFDLIFCVSSICCWRSSLARLWATWCAVCPGRGWLFL
jgi:cytochrome bd-type quinol oxidase subunit 2